MAKHKLIKIAVGKVMLVEDFSPKPGKIVLVHENGEAGQFDRAKLAKVIEQFFNKHF